MLKSKTSNEGGGKVPLQILSNVNIKGPNN